MGEVAKFKSNHAYGELKSRLVGKAPPSRKDAQNTFLTLNEFLESKFSGTKGKLNSVDAVAIGVRHGIDPDLLISVKKSAEQVIIARTGQVIYGESSSDLFGWSTDMSEDGLHIAVGSILNDGTDTNAGSVRVYSRLNEDDAWVQKGVDIDGEAAQDYSGWSISLSSDGNRLVVGAVFNDFGSTINSGHVRIYDWNSGTTQWILRSELTGDSAGDFFGYSVSLSKNKNYLAVGAPYGLDTRGYVRVYYWDESNWVQVGSRLEGANPSPNGEYFGKSVALSEDGSRLVVSSPHYYFKTGKVNLYNVDQSSNSINLLDSKVGSTFFSSSGNSLDLKSNIVALSETGYIEPKIIVYDITSDSFVEQSNNKITLVNPFDVRVKLSYDGTNLIYGMSGFNSDSGVINSRNMIGMKGHVNVYKRHNDRWIQKGWKMNPIGGGQTDEFGKSVSISGDGGIICISAPRKDVPSTDTGCVTTYTVKPISHYVTPTISLNSLNPFPLQANTSYVEPGAVTDTGADVTIVGDIEDSTIEGAQYDILYTSQNGFGNVVTKTRKVIIIKDPAIPTMVLNGDSTILVKVNGIFNDPGVTTSILSTITTDNSTLNLNKLGAYEVSYTAVSSYGIKSSQVISRTVVVVNDIDFTGSALTGKNVCMSTDGFMVGVGDFADATVVFNEWDPVVNDWKAIGQKIQGPTNSSFSGALALSNDGLTVVIGAPTFNSTGLVRVYGYDFTVNKWVQKGEDIMGDTIGEFVTISGDGSVVSCGASQPTGVKNPYIFTYKYSSSSNTWVKIHEYMEPITLGKSVDKKKFSGALNNDGSLLLIGSPMNNYTTGAVFVYDTSDASLKFSVLGAAVGNYFGESVNFSANARRLVIGDVGGACVKIYSQDEVTNVWNQLGSKIYEAGTSVNLSKNGDIVTFSIPATQGYGKVYQYKWDGLFWLPIIDEFSDNGNGTSFGRQVFVSEDGSSILVESAITNQLYRWNVVRPVFSLNGNRIIRRQVDQVYNYDHVITSANVVISGVVDTSVTSEYVIKYTLTENDVSDVVYQVVSISGELLQLGLTITSSTPNKLGWSTSMSGDGNYLVVGMPGYDEDRGMVKIYQLNLTDVTWDEMISLTGPNVGGSFGYDVSISRDGSRVAIGAPDFGTGMVQVYEYTAAWGLLGSQINGDETGGKFGWSVSLNGSGEYLTVGEPRRSFQINTGVGGVKTYRYISSQWEPQTSLSFDNTQVEHQIGYDAVISSSNNVVLFSAPTVGPGYVKISSYLNGNVPIFGQPMTFGERFGWCVSISDDGTIFAVGAPFFNAKRGRVLIYDATTTPPSLKGSPIEGANENDELGSSLHLIGNGQKLLLYSKQGRVSNYQYVGSEWVVISDEIITSQVTDSNFGYSLSSSTTGARMVISSPLFENSSGMVQIFSTETVQISNADFIPPVITLNGESLIVHEKDTTFNDPGVTRDDGEVSFDVTGAIDSSAVGSYTLAYSATDVAGNVSNPLSRIVNIKDPNELNHLSKFPAPTSRDKLKYSRNSNTTLSGKRVAICTPAVKVYDVSDDVYPPVYNQVGQVLPDGNQVGLSQDGTNLYISEIIDETESKLSVYSLNDSTHVYAQTPFATNTGIGSAAVTLFGWENKDHYKSTKQGGDVSHLFGTGVQPYGEQYRQSFKFKSLAMSNDGACIAIGKPEDVATPSVSIYKLGSGVNEVESFNQIGYTTSGSFRESLAVSELGDRMITQDQGQVLIYNRDDSSANGWNLESEHTATTQVEVAMSHDGNVAGFNIPPSVNVDPIILNGNSIISHQKGQVFNDPGFSYSGGGSVTVTGTVDTDTPGEYIIGYESPNNKQVRIVRVNYLPTLSTFNGSYSTTNIPYGPNFAGYTGTWRNQDFPLFTVPVDFIQPINSEFELSITLNGRAPSTHSGGWQYMSIQIYTDNGFSSSIGFSTNGSGPGESYSYSGTTFNNRIRTKTTIDSGSLSAGDQVRGRLHIFNTFFSTFDVDVTTTFSIVATTTPVPIPKVTLIGFPQNNVDVGENFVDPGVTSDNPTDVISVIDAPTFPQATSSIQPIIYRAVNTSGVSGYAVRYVNIADVEKVVIYRRTGITWSQVANSISPPASLETYSFKDISLSSNGNRVVFSKYNKNIVYDLDQTAYPQVWTKTGEITRDAVYIKMSGDGNRIVMGDSIGRVHLYEYSNGVWGQELTIPHNSSLPGYAGDYETASIDISKGGEYIIVGYKSSSQNGAVTVYTIDGSTRGQTITSSVSPFVVGNKVSISSDGTKLLTMKSVSGLITFAYYEYNSESASWIEHGPDFDSGLINLLNLSLSGNGNNLLLLYENRFITNTPATELIDDGWEKVGSDIAVGSITYPPYHKNQFGFNISPPDTPGNRETPGGILTPTGRDEAVNLAEIGHVVEISDDGLTVAVGLPFLQLGTSGVTVTRGAAAVFQFIGTNWVQLGGLIVPKYENNPLLTVAQNLKAESTMYSGASISLSGDCQYLCVGSPGYHADAADKVINSSWGADHINQRLNSLPSADGATKWTLYKRNATYAPANDYYSVGWEPIHTKYSEMSESLSSISTIVPKRELIGHNVKVSSDGSFVVYDTRTDGIKIVTRTSVVTHTATAFGMVRDDGSYRWRINDSDGHQVALPAIIYNPTLSTPAQVADSSTMGYWYNVYLNGSQWTIPTNPTTNTWVLLQHIPNGVTTYLNDINVTIYGTTYPYPIHFLGKKVIGFDPFVEQNDPYVEDWGAALDVGKGGYVARMWPHSYISLSSNDKFLTVSEPEVTLPTKIRDNRGYNLAHTFNKSNRSARVNVYERNSDTAQLESDVSFQNLMNSLKQNMTGGTLSHYDPLSITMSKDGTHLAISSPFGALVGGIPGPVTETTTGASIKSWMQVYEFVNSSWVKKGGVITSTTGYIGEHIGISSDGTRLIVSGFLQPTTAANKMMDPVVYMYEYLNGTWYLPNNQYIGISQLKGDLPGVGGLSTHGIRDVTISDDGTKIAFIVRFYGDQLQFNTRSVTLEFVVILEYDQGHYTSLPSSGQDTDGNLTMGQILFPSIFHTNGFDKQLFETVIPNTQFRALSKYTDSIRLHGTGQGNWKFSHLEIFKSEFSLNQAPNLIASVEHPEIHNIISGLQFKGNDTLIVELYDNMNGELFDTNGNALTFELYKPMRFPIILKHDGTTVFDPANVTMYNVQNPSTGEWENTRLLSSGVFNRETGWMRIDMFVDSGYEPLGFKYVPYSIDFSDDMSRVVFGIPHVNKNRGKVQVFDLTLVPGGMKDINLTDPNRSTAYGDPSNPVNTQSYKATQVGIDIDGYQFKERLGENVSISGDGSRIIIGNRPYFDDTRFSTNFDTPSETRFYIFKYSTALSLWSQVVNKSVSLVSPAPWISSTNAIALNTFYAHVGDLSGSTPISGTRGSTFDFDSIRGRPTMLPEYSVEIGPDASSPPIYPWLRSRSRQSKVKISNDGLKIVVSVFNEVFVYDIKNEDLGVGSWVLHGAMIESTSIPNFASSYSSISDDGTKLVVPAKDNYSQFYICDYTKSTDSWTIGTPNNIESTNDGLIDKAAAQSVTLMSGDATKVGSLYFGDESVYGSTPVFKQHLIASFSPASSWLKRGSDILLISPQSNVINKIKTEKVEALMNLDLGYTSVTVNVPVRAVRYERFSDPISLKVILNFTTSVQPSEDYLDLSLNVTYTSSNSQNYVGSQTKTFPLFVDSNGAGVHGDKVSIGGGSSISVSNLIVELQLDKIVFGSNHSDPLGTAGTVVVTITNNQNPNGLYVLSDNSKVELLYTIGYFDDETRYSTFSEFSQKVITPSVSISNDATKLAVGLANENEIKIFNYSNSWSQVSEIKNNTLGAQFGDQLVLTRDGNSLAVSAPGNGEIFLYDTSTNSVTLKANTLQNTSVHSNGNFGYSLGLSNDCTRLFIGDPDYSNDVSDITRDTGRVVIKEYDATIDGGTGLPLGFSLGTEIEITRGGALQVATDKHTRFGESLDVSGDGTRLIASRFGLLDTSFSGNPYTGLEIAELWELDGTWSKRDLTSPMVPIMTGSITPWNSERYYQNPIVKISDSGNYFLYGVSERQNYLGVDAYGSNVALTTTQQYFSPILTLNGASRIEIIIGLPYTELGCTSDDPNDTIVITGNVDITVLGEYTVRYTVTRFGLSNFIERKVVIKISTVPPTITLIGDPVINLFQPVVYTEPNPGATVVGGILETYGSPPDGSSSGTFTMRYVVRNTFGTASVQRTITIENDTTPPVITPWGGDVTHKVNTRYNDPSYVGSDGNEAILVSTPSYALTISNIRLYRGTNLITYSATDQSGNIGTFVRNVDVKDGMEATTIQQQLDDSYYSAISNDGSRQAIIRKTNNSVVIYGVPASSIQMRLSGFGSMEGQMVKLSSDGTVMAFTTPDGVYVYAYDLGLWIERPPHASSPRFTVSGSHTYKIDLSNDGNTIAVSYIGGNEQYLEEVVIFRWNSTQYVEDHSIANGSAVVTGLGDTISLSSDGNRIALGSSKITTGSGSNISSTIYSFATPPPTLHGVHNWYGSTQRGYKLTNYGVGGSNNTMYWPVTLGASWSVSWDWYIYGPRWGGADDMRLIYYATNPITAYQASVHNGYNNFYEFWQGDTHQIRDNKDVYKKWRNVYYPLSRWLTVEVSYDNGVMTSTVKKGNTVRSTVSHNFGTAHQSLYGVQTYFGFSGRTGGVSSSQYIRNIKLKSTQDNVGQIEVYDRNGANSWSQVGADIQGGLENQGLGKNVKLSGDGSTIFNKNEGLDANGQNVSVFALNSGTWTKNSTLIDNLNTRTVLTGNTHELIDISDDGSLLIYAKGTGSEKYVSHPSGLSTKYIDGYKLESGVYKHTLTIPESSSSPTKHVEVTGDGSTILIHTDNEVVLHSITDTVFNPVITLNHFDYVDALSVYTYTEQGATSNVTDGSSVVVGGDTVTNTAGTYRVRYSVTDSNTGKSAHRTRTVTIL